MATTLQSRIHAGKGKALWLIIPAILLLLAWPPVRGVLGQVALALLLTAACLPLHKKLATRLPENVAALISVIGVLCIVIGAIVLVLPQVIKRIYLLIGQLPGLIASLQDIWKQISQTEWFRAMNLDTSLPNNWLAGMGDFAAKEAPRLLARLAGGVEVISRAFLAPVLSYYFLRDRAFFSYQISLLIPVKYRKTSLKILREMRRELGSYLRGQVMISLAVAVLTTLGLFALGIPSFIALGILMGVCEMIPYIGPLIGGIPVVLFSLPLGLNRTLWAVALVILVQQAEGYFLSPRLMAGAVALHPVYILLLLTGGGLVGGLVGMMAAIPLFVCARGAMRIIYVEKQPEKVVKYLGNDKV